MNNKSALVVDDSRVARMTLSRNLRLHGFETTELGSGEEALSWLKTTTEQPDIIFMDVMMEGMDGLSATRQIRTLPQSRGIPVIICTGNDTQEDRLAAMSAGAEAVLTKPPKAEAVQTLLGQVETKLAATKVETPVVERIMPTPSPVPQSDMPAPAPIDEDVLVKKVLQSFREQFMPGLETQLGELSDDVGRKAASEVAMQVSHQQTQSIIADIPNQINAAVDESKSRVEDMVSDAVSASVTLAVEQAAREYMLSDKMMDVITSQGSDWLKQKEQPFLQEVKQHLQTELPTIVNHYLDVTLTDKVKPLIEDQLQAYIEEKSEEHNQQLNKLRSQISSANTVSFIAVFIAIAAVAAAFLV